MNGIGARLLFFTASLVVVGCSPEQPAPSSGLVAIVGATIIDGTGAAPIVDGVIVLDGERITAVGPSSAVAIPEGAAVVSAQGRWIIPGMIDLHTHFWESGRPGAQPTYVADVTEVFPYDEEVAWMKGRVRYTLARYLCSGVTSAVVLGAIPWEYEIRELAKAERVAPRIILAGGFIGNSPPEESSPFWEGEQPGYWIENEASAEALVQHLDSTGVDLIKAGFVANPEHPLELFRPALRALVEASHARNLLVFVHATELESARAAVEVGADVLAHTVGDRDLDDDFVSALKAAGVTTTSSIGVLTGHARLLRDSFELTRAEERCGDPQVTEAWQEWAALPFDSRPELPGWLEDAQTVEDQIVENLRVMNEAGIRIAVGSDGGNIGSMHGPSFQRELILLAKAGLDPMQILISATRSGAAAIGRLDDLGTLEPGKLGDLVILEANPLDAVENFQRVESVFVRGSLVTRQEWEEVRE